VDGAILYVYKYCDPFGFEVPARKAYYKSINVPLLHLEDVYSAGTIGQLRTRIQAFLEMIVDADPQFKSPISAFLKRVRGIRRF